MKLKSIKLHPFAGIREREVNLKDQLNVLCGPNEIGKSTIFHAILNGLLTTTSLTAKQLEDAMGRFFPVSGGDTIRVTLELEGEDKGIILITKTWKKGSRNGSASLHLPDGTEITDEEEVQRHIEELLPVSPATMKTLGDILRQKLMETGGVSVDRFRELLDQKYEEYFKRWDREQDYPERNRGINNPYKTGTGLVLNAYYRKEQLQLDLDEARIFEDELDRLNGELSELIEQKEEKKREFDKLEPLKRGISQRQVVEQKLDAAKEKQSRLIEVNKQWPVMEDRLKQLEPKKEKLQQKIEALSKEQKLAQNKLKAENLKAKLKKVEELNKKVEDAKKEIEESHKIESADVQALKDLHADIRNLKSRIEGARLTLRLESDSEKTVQFRESGKEDETISISSGKKVEKEAGGGFRLTIDGVRVNVFSGDGDLEKTVEEVSQKERELADELNELNVDSLQSAESVLELYNQKKQDLANASQLLKAELEGTTEEALKQEYAELGDLDKVRELAEISDEMVDIWTDLNDLSAKADEAREKLDVWKERYESSENLLLELADLTRSIKEYKTELDSLPELPQGFESADEFIEKVERLDRTLRDLGQQINDKKLEKTQKEGEAPDTSSEELENMLDEAESEFERIHHEAETLAKVRDRTIKLLESMDAETYSGLEKSFIDWLGRMTEGRFDTIEMNADLPSTFQTSDGRPLTYELLSHGTKDVVALAWRFALTEHFMQGKAGFIILDDPMVDMDPERRKMASEAIEEFAKEQQVLVMTCHPEHKELLKYHSLVEFQS